MYRSLKMAKDRKLVFDDGAVYLVDMCDEFWLPWLNSVLQLTARINAVLDEDLTGFCCLMALLLFMPGITVMLLYNNSFNMKTVCRKCSTGKS